MVVVHKDTGIVAVGLTASRVDAQGETGLIQVRVGTGEGEYYYLGNTDRDTYGITEVPAVPDDYPGVSYTFDGQNFVKEQ